jgi:acetyl esterase/lipase
MKALNGTIMSIAAITVISLTAQAVPMKDLMQDPPAAQERVFKKVGDLELKLYYFAPSGQKPGDHRPATVWIHGGGWTGGTLDGFMPHSRYFATRGIAAFTVW